ncbi:MAG: ABC-2 transporter permease [Woeseiaceae bacterium]|nr:ABC-2 transporter permease [Woeseiaceae bacterium]
MIAHQLALVRREFWEHRAIWIAPAAVALVLTLLVATSFVAASNFGEVVDLAILGASNVGDAERRAALMAFLAGNTVIFVIEMWILTVFYGLDALYAERKDKSILFWRSLPITDAETVVSKLLTAAVLIPVVTFVAVVGTHLVTLGVTSIWVNMQGASPMRIIWNSAPLFDAWAAILIVLLATPVWLSPFIGWFLFVSAWTKRSPLLMAFLPLFVVPMLEYFTLRTSFLWTAIRTRVDGIPLFRGFDPGRFFDEHDLRVTAESVSLLGQLDVIRFLTSPGLWAGLVVCGLFSTAAIYVRRFRDES